VQESKPGAFRLVEPRDQARPQRCNGARAADDGGYIVDQDAITGFAVAVGGDVRYTATDFAAGIRRLRHASPLLVVGQLEHHAYTASCRPAIVGVPHGLEGDRTVLGLEVRAAAGKNVRARGEESTVARFTGGSSLSPGHPS
jgi:hypothetical protein